MRIVDAHFRQTLRKGRESCAFKVMIYPRQKEDVWCPQRDHGQCPFNIGSVALLDVLELKPRPRPPPVYRVSCDPDRLGRGKRWPKGQQKDQTGTKSA